MVTTLWGTNDEKVILWQNLLSKYSEDVSHIQMNQYKKNVVPMYCTVMTVYCLLGGNFWRASNPIALPQRNVTELP